MQILVANLGSTSFKYRLYSCAEGVLEQLTQGGYERVTDYGAAIEEALGVMREGGFIAGPGSIAAVGFKTVLGREKTGCVDADGTVIDDLRRSATLAPAHNPAYANGIEQFARLMPEARLVALYETAFYQWTSSASRRYAVPQSWYDAGVRRNGFHGASHKYVAERSAELLGRADIADRVRRLYLDGPRPVAGAPLRVVSCHLGGSSSVTGICNGIAVDTSMGLSPQSGLPQNNRVGDLDAMAVTYVMQQLGLSVAQVEAQMTRESGLLGLSGISNDIRDLREAAAGKGNERARLALESLVTSIRHYIGAYAFQMGGLDAIVFTAGIGENDSVLRAEVCAGWEDLGVRLDPELNAGTLAREGRISAEGSPVKVWVIPANEEAVVAIETWRRVCAQSQ